MSKFDLKVCKDQHGGKATFRDASGVVEILAGPFDSPDGERYTVRHTYGVVFIAAASELVNLSPPVPAEPEVRWVASWGNPSPRDGSLMTGRACTTRDGGESWASGREHELHRLYMGCLDAGELWEKYKIWPEPSPHRPDVFRVTRWFRDRWLPLNAQGEFVYAADGKNFPTYGSALKAASDASKSL